jgi:hypothetical protein
MMYATTNPYLHEEVHTRTDLSPQDYFDQWKPLIPIDEHIDAAREGPADDEDQVEELLDYFEALY